MLASLSSEAKVWFIAPYSEEITSGSTNRIASEPRSLTMTRISFQATTRTLRMVFIAPPYS
jgi:hypothetical protein